MYSIDKQTLLDLGLNSENNNLMSLFRKAVTDGGNERISEYFENPLDNIEEITNRQKTICFLSKNKVDYLIDRYILMDLERYLNLTNKPFTDLTYNKLILNIYSVFSLKSKKDAFFLKRSICEISELILNLNDFFNNIDTLQDTGTIKLIEREFKQLTKELDIEELKLLSFKNISLKKLPNMTICIETC